MIQKKEMAFDSQPEMEVEAEVDTPDMEMAEAETMTPEGETAVISMEMLGGKKVSPGERVTLEVVSASDEDGTIVVRYPSQKPSGGGIREAAAAFDMKG